MAIQADIPSYLQTDDDKAFFFQYLDAELNSVILYALLYGVYTGIISVTLWNIFINQRRPIRRGLVVVIMLLHALITLGFGANWSCIRSAFIEHGQSFWTVYLNLRFAQAAYWERGITMSMSTILTDLYMIWCCWMVWGRRWLVVLLPIISLISATTSKIMAVYLEYLDGSPRGFLVPYATLTLVTTLWCTLLIIYRILIVAGIGRGAEGRLRFYHCFIEVLVESSALYSISLILYLAFTIRNNLGAYYLDTIAGIAKGVAPTLLVTRVTTGHRARPDDSWQGSVMASASIMSQSQDRSRASFQEDDPTSPMLDGDLEAQHEISVREPSPTLRSVSVVADHAHPNADVAPESMTSLPHLKNRSPLHDSLPPSEDVICRSTVVDEAAAPSR